MNPSDLFMIVLVGILLYLGAGMWICNAFDPFDQDIECAVIVLWPVMIVLGFVLMILAILKSTVIGCVKLLCAFWEVFG